ncbi:MAG TPA: hypothetical protein VMM60_14620, partial [Ilumatobacter sp.]|nr:hypothetical protein [Ilumatobacter sp.]
TTSTTQPFIVPGQTTTTTTPGQLALSATSLDFGTSANALTVTLSNPGGQPVSWAASTGSPFAVSPATGTLPAGGSAQLTVTYDRNGVPENTTSTGTLSVTGGSASASAGLSGRVMRPPTITVINTFCQAVNFGAGTQYSFHIEVRTADENPSTPQPSGSISSPSGDTRSLAFTFRSPSWYSSATLTTANPAGPPVTEFGTWSWTVSATDAFGNVGTASGSIPINANNC